MVTQPDKTWTEDAFKNGVTDLLEKPFESFFFIDKFRGHIAQAQLKRSSERRHELILDQLLLTTTKVNRLYETLGKTAEKPIKKLRYAHLDEDQVRFEHARKSEEMLLHAIEQCRIEYLKLAERLRVS
jgi:hypothetical protein